MASSEKPEIDAFLAGIDAKIAALQQLRDGYVAALAAGLLGQGGLDVASLAQPVALPTASIGQPTPSGPVELPTGVFRTKGMADAIRLYLSITKRKQTMKEIAAALQEGGLATTAENFEQSLTTTLYRLKNSGELLKFKDGWDLAASYPDSFRQRLAQNSDDAPKRKRKTKKRAAAKKAAKASATPKPQKTEAKQPRDEPTLRAVS